VEVGDLVSTDDSSRGPVGVVVEIIKRLYNPTVKVFIEGKVKEFDMAELWSFYESR
jgi:hypothetical protein